MYKIINLDKKVLDSRNTFEEVTLSASCLVGDYGELLISDEQKSRVIYDISSDGIGISFSKFALLDASDVITVCKEFLKSYKVKKLTGYNNTNGFLMIDDVQDDLSLNYHFGDKNNSIDMTENVESIIEFLYKISVECSMISTEYLRSLYIPLFDWENLGVYAFHNRFTGYLEYVILPQDIESFIKCKKLFNNNFIV